MLPKTLLQSRYAALAAVLITSASVSGCWWSDDAESPPAVVTPTPAPSAPQRSQAGGAVPEGILLVLIDAEPERGAAPLSVDFGIYDPYQTLERPTYVWNFGDGSPESNERGPIHVFEKPGRYTVTLKIEDGGATDEDSVEIQVTEPSPGQ